MSNTTPFKNKSLGTQVLVPMPATVAGMVEKFGEESIWGAVARYICYQKWNPKFRKALVEKLAEETGVAIREIGKKKVRGEEVPVYESEATYIAFLLTAESGSNLTEARYEQLAQEVADTVPVELNITEGDDKPDKEFYRAARQKLAEFEAGTADADVFTANFESKNPGFTLEGLGGLTEDGIARAYEVNHKRVQRESAAQL